MFLLCPFCQSIMGVWIDQPDHWRLWIVCEGCSANAIYCGAQMSFVKSQLDLMTTLGGTWVWDELTRGKELLKPPIVRNLPERSTGEMCHRVL